jgi:hypothetical protein
MVQSIDHEMLPLTAANGHANGHSNGHSGSSNGLSTSKRRDVEDYDEGASFRPLWKGSEVDRREFVRLSLQMFREMGYRRVPYPSLTAPSSDTEMLQLHSGRACGRIWLHLGDG